MDGSANTAEFPCKKIKNNNYNTSSTIPRHCSSLLIRYVLILDPDPASGDKDRQTGKRSLVKAPAHEIPSCELGKTHVI